MSSSNSHSISIQDDGVRLIYAFWCDIHHERPDCPFTLLSYVGEVHKLQGNAMFCALCPTYQAIVERYGKAVQ